MARAKRFLAPLVVVLLVAMAILTAVGSTYASVPFAVLLLVTAIWNAYVFLIWRPRLARGVHSEAPRPEPACEPQPPLVSGKALEYTRLAKLWIVTLSALRPLR